MRTEFATTGGQRAAYTSLARAADLPLEAIVELAEEDRLLLAVWRAEERTGERGEQRRAERGRAAIPYIVETKRKRWPRPS